MKRFSESDMFVAKSAGADGPRLGPKVPVKIRLMRGQVVVREEVPAPSAVLWTPEHGRRQMKTHRGIVLDLRREMRERQAQHHHAADNFYVLTRRP
jgi:hypothetical protein